MPYIRGQPGRHNYEMVADAVVAFKPKVLYPYHYGDTDTARLIELLTDTPEVEIRIRTMK